MTRDEAFAAWAPADGIWSDWVKPVLFAQMPAEWRRQDGFLPQPAEHFAQLEGNTRTAVVVDVGGGASVLAGLALARRGFRPVPLFNGAADSSEPALSDAELPSISQKACINVWPIMRALWLGATELPLVAMAADAPPAFLLDSRRRIGERAAGAGMFDNRWLTFPTDFPSARLLQERGIERAVIVTEGESAPATDLAHTLLRWQQAGIDIRVLSSETDEEPHRITVERPGLFRAAWYQFAHAVGLHRNLLGGFGGRMPEAGGGG